MLLFVSWLVCYLFFYLTCFCFAWLRMTGRASYFLLFSFFFFGCSGKGVEEGESGRLSCRGMGRGKEKGNREGQTIRILEWLLSIAVHMVYLCIYPSIRLFYGILDDISNFDVMLHVRHRIDIRLFMPRITLIIRALHTLLSPRR